MNIYVIGHKNIIFICSPSHVHTHTRPLTSSHFLIFRYFEWRKTRYVFLYLEPACPCLKFRAKLEARKGTRYGLIRSLGTAFMPDDLVIYLVGVYLLCVLIGNLTSEIVSNLRSLSFQSFIDYSKSLRKLSQILRILTFKNIKTIVVFLLFSLFSLSFLSPCSSSLFLYKSFSTKQFGLEREPYYATDWFGLERLSWSIAWPGSDLSYSYVDSSSKARTCVQKLERQCV